MTREEFIKEYGDVVVTFSDYYKYVFNYTGTTADGTEVIAHVGGNADDIYRLNVANGETSTVADLYPNGGIATKDGNIIDDFWEY